VELRTVELRTVELRTVELRTFCGKCQVCLINVTEGSQTEDSELTIICMVQLLVLFFFFFFDILGVRFHLPKIRVLQYLSVIFLYEESRGKENRRGVK
jgi:hypothetical protein